RVVKLEARQRWTTRAAVVVVSLMIVAGATMGQAPRQPQVPLGINQLDELRQLPGSDRPLSQQTVRLPEPEVRSQHFVLTDSKGKDRASLVADNAGSVFLVLFDASGKTRANLSVGNEGPSLIFYDQFAQPRAIIGSTTLVGSHVNENGIAEKAPA